MDERVISDWNSEGVDETSAQDFVMQLQSIDALKLFVKALPQWVRENDTAIDIHIQSDPKMDGGVGISISFDKQTLPTSQANELIERMIETNQLMDLERSVEILKGHGADPLVIDALVEQADRLAEKLFKQ